jgi:hypothetical protein
LNQEKGGDGVKIVERIPERYEVQEEVEDFARTYRWCPEQVVLECGACGTRMTLKRSTLIASMVTCECGARTTASVREELSVELPSEDEVVHPWRYWPSREEAAIPV